MLGGAPGSGENPHRRRYVRVRDADPTSEAGCSLLDRLYGISHVVYQSQPKTVTTSLLHCHLDKKHAAAVLVQTDVS